ncbi:NADPH-dependent FMN reductase [Actinoplanes palleronii]|uniref:FMN reductase n=1 Tax=Actinoplanes palleronii TaxID=113570 RepID=A0ABQ4BGQ8_9ACTN|nr:NAD(P)H-dependent oxidoreductase [Actinoplanes palleronii]GIE69842.1 FMN reductase [Actinoplanes palleronii]
MADLKIAVIAGSTRPGRKSRTVAEWVLDRAAGRPGAGYHLLDLADAGLPLLDEPASAKVAGPAGYTREHTRRWSATVAGYDGFVFVTPEYNHSVSGVLKNAVDFLYHEWANKAAALVSYGGAGGARAIEHLRGILSEVQIAHVQQSLSLSAFTDFEGWRTEQPTLAPSAVQDIFLPLMLTQLETWATAMRAVRQNALAPAA